jgi:hypothetical protein
MADRLRGRDTWRHGLLLGIGSSALVAFSLVAAACGDDTKDSPPGTDEPRQDGGTSGQGTDGSSSSGDAPGPSSTYVDFDINHVLVTGQSNSTGNAASPPLSTEQPFTNLMFDTGVMPMKGGFVDPSNHASAKIAGCDGEGCTTYETPKSFVPLREGDTYFDYQVETPAAGIANEISLLATTKLGRPKHDVLVSVQGRSGVAYSCLRKINCNYKPDYLNAFEQGMKEVESAKAIAAAAGKSYVVRAVATVHGETDQEAYLQGHPEFPLDGAGGKPVADYADALLEWQRDYETGIKQITSQPQSVPLLVSQISGWRDVAVSKVAQFQLDAHIKAPGKVVLVGPAYALSIDQNDCLHFKNDGERRLGEYFAKVYAAVVIEGKTWEPVRPKTVTLDGAVITVVFHVPMPPLAFDTTQVAAATNQGFGYADDSGGAAPAITKVELGGPDTVKITLASAPTGANKRVRYAMNQAAGACIGTPNGARGNLRDSDDTPSQNGYALQNWAVHFDVAVP